MSLIEAMTMAAGLVYLVLLAWQARSGWPWRLALGLLFLLWLVATDSLLWLALGLVVVPLALWHRYRPQPALGELGSQPLRSWARHLLLLCWGLVAVQYGLHVWQLGQGTSPWLVRPDVVDGFLPIAGGLGLRAWLGQGLVDPHHPAATITVLVLSLSALLLGRAFCSWFCPLGLVGEWLHRLRTRLLPGEWVPPRWLDWLLRAQKFLVLGFLLFIILLAVPAAALSGYLASPYHQAADMKMGAFFFNLTLISGLCLCWVLLLTATAVGGPMLYLVDMRLAPAPHWQVLPLALAACGADVTPSTGDASPSSAGETWRWMPCARPNGWAPRRRSSTAAAKRSFRHVSRRSITPSRRAG